MTDDEADILCFVAARAARRAREHGTTGGTWPEVTVPERVHEASGSWPAITIPARTIPARTIPGGDS